jgi:hypothetical protein
MNVASLVYYLKRTKPELILGLQRSNAAAQELFSDKKVLGDSPVYQAPEDSEMQAAQLALLSQGAIQLGVDLDAAVTQVKRRIGSARKVRLLGGVVAAVAGTFSAVLAFLIKQKSWDGDLVLIAGSIVSAMGGVLTLLADHIEKSPSGTQLSIPKDLMELVEARVAIERFNRKVERRAAFPLTPDELLSASTVLDNAAETLIRFSLVRD